MLEAIFLLTVFLVSVLWILLAVEETRGKTVAVMKSLWQGGAGFLRRHEERLREFLDAAWVVLSTVGIAIYAITFWWAFSTVVIALLAVTVYGLVQLFLIAIKGEGRMLIEEATKTVNAAAILLGCALLLSLANKLTRSRLLTVIEWFWRGLLSPTRRCRRLLGAVWTFLTSLGIAVGALTIMCIAYTLPFLVVGAIFYGLVWALLSIIF